MNTKRKYSVIPIYSVALVWAIWAFVLKFNGIGSYVFCTIVSAGVGVGLWHFFSPLETSDSIPEVDTSLTIEPESTWDTVIDMSAEQLSRLQNTPIADSLNTLHMNVLQIGKAICDDPSRANLPFVCKFKERYIEYSEDLTDYESCSKIPNQGKKIKTLLHLTEEKFEKLARISDLLLDDVYGKKNLSLSADKDVIEQLFSPLEDKSDFQSLEV